MKIRPYSPLRDLKVSRRPRFMPWDNALKCPRASITVPRNWLSTGPWSRSIFPRKITMGRPTSSTWRTSLKSLRSWRRMRRSSRSMSDLKSRWLRSRPPSCQTSWSAFRGIEMNSSVIGSKIQKYWYSVTEICCKTWTRGTCLSTKRRLSSSNLRLAIELLQKVVEARRLWALKYRIKAWSRRAWSQQARCTISRDWARVHQVSRHDSAPYFPLWTAKMSSRLSKSYQLSPVLPQLLDMRILLRVPWKVAIEASQMARLWTHPIQGERAQLWATNLIWIVSNPWFAQKSRELRPTSQPRHWTYVSKTQTIVTEVMLRWANCPT